MDWTLSNSIVHWLVNRNTKGTEIPGRGGTLPGYQKDTNFTGSGILVNIKGIINTTIGYDTGASTMHRTLPSSLSITMSPSAEETVIAGGESIH